MAFAAFTALPPVTGPSWMTIGCWPPRATRGSITASGASRWSEDEIIQVLQEFQSYGTSYGLGGDNLNVDK